jgi:hypothetical protein
MDVPLLNHWRKIKTKVMYICILWRQSYSSIKGTINNTMHDIDRNKDNHQIKK